MFQPLTKCCKSLLQVIRSTLTQNREMEPSGVYSQPVEISLVRARRLAKCVHDPIAFTNCFVAFSSLTMVIILFFVRLTFSFGQSVIALAGTLPVQLTMLGVLGYVASKVVLGGD